MDVIQNRIDALDWMLNRGKEWKSKLLDDGEWSQGHERALEIQRDFIETEIEEIMVEGDEVSANNK